MGIDEKFHVSSFSLQNCGKTFHPNLLSFCFCSSAGQLGCISHSEEHRLCVLAKEFGSVQPNVVLGVGAARPFSEVKPGLLHSGHR